MATVSYDAGFRYGETVTWNQYYTAGRDAYGKAISGFRPFEVRRVSVQARNTVEAKDGTVQRADVDYILFVPSELPVDSKDTFTIRGRVCTVTGVAENVTNNFSGTKFRTEVKVKRTNG